MHTGPKQKKWTVRSKSHSPSSITYWISVDHVAYAVNMLLCHPYLVDLSPFFVVVFFLFIWSAPLVFNLLYFCFIRVLIYVLLAKWVCDWRESDSIEYWPLTWWVIIFLNWSEWLKSFLGTIRNYTNSLKWMVKKLSWNNKKLYK